VRKIIKRISKKSGLPPGTLIHVGEKKIEKSRITIIDYDEEQYQEKEVEKIEECFEYKDKPTITWINIDGLHEVDIIEKIGKCFELHPLLLEDILNTAQRPKIEDFEKYIFIVLKMLDYDDTENQVKIEQISLVLGSNYLLTFQEMRGDIFNRIRDRIRNGKGRIRKMHSDYLAYVIIDSIVDHYFSILEKIGDKLENIEEELITNPTIETSYTIHNMKREMIFLRKSIWPLREIVNSFERYETPLIKKTTSRYIRDVYDHTIQVIDTVESFRDIISGLLDLYLSTISNRMNEVMKVLTMIATIFIPITFIAGIYGMNFNYMPELQWQGGYPATIMVMAAISIIMIFFFKKRKWL